MSDNPRRVPLERVFAATDFSEGASRAISRAGSLPLADAGEITVIHVLSDEIPRKVRPKAEELARRQLEQATKSLSKAANTLSGRDIKVSGLCHGESMWRSSGVPGLLGWISSFSAAMAVDP
jgi:nucleotide-binding universal stress UspA family protein